MRSGDNARGACELLSSGLPLRESRCGSGVCAAPRRISKAEDLNRRGCIPAGYARTSPQTALRARIDVGAYLRGMPRHQFHATPIRRPGKIWSRLLCERSPVSAEGGSLNAAPFALAKTLNGCRAAPRRAENLENRSSKLMSVHTCGVCTHVSSNGPPCPD